MAGVRRQPAPLTPYFSLPPPMMRAFFDFRRASRRCIFSPRYFAFAATPPPLPPL